MDQDQAIRTLQAQVAQSQEAILHLIKGQEEIRELLIQRGRQSRKPVLITAPAPQPQLSRHHAFKRHFTRINMTYSRALQQLLHLGLITVIDTPSRPNTASPQYNPNQRCAYHSNSLGHDTNDCWALKNEIQDMIDAGDITFTSPEASAVTATLPVIGRPKPAVPRRPISRISPESPAVTAALPVVGLPKPAVPRRPISRINMPSDQVLQYLLETELITLKEPPQNPNTASPRYNPNERCAYHSDSPGHSTNKCWTLKYKIQDLIDAGKFTFDSPKAPKVITPTDH